MAIPGGEQMEPVGKVRIGEKAGQYAKSLNYFRSNEPEFAEIVKGQQSELLIGFFSDNPEEAFISGLEWWVKKNDKPILACYTKDGGPDPVALRIEAYKDEGDKVLGPKRGNNRLPIVCPFRECVHFKAKQCRPTARLDFYLKADPQKRLWRMDTKGWNSIEELTKALAPFNDLTKRTFKLLVTFETKGEKRFPVLRLEEQVIVTSDNIDLADALVALTKAGELCQYREGLFAYLNATSPGWDGNAAMIERIKEVGVEQAVKTILERARRS